LDLHSRNTYIGILDNEFKQVFKKRTKMACAALDVDAANKNFKFCDGEVFSLDSGLLMGARVPGLKNCSIQMAILKTNHSESSK
jgi:hypothetical protein